MIEGIDSSVLDTIKEICKENPEIAIKEYFNYIKSKEIVKYKIPFFASGKSAVTERYQANLPSNLATILKLRQEKDEIRECILFSFKDSLNKKLNKLILFDDYNLIKKEILPEDEGEQIGIAKVTDSSRITLPRDIFNKSEYAYFLGREEYIEVIPLR